LLDLDFGREKQRIREKVKEIASMAGTLGYGLEALGGRLYGRWMIWGFDYWAGQGTVLLIHGSIHPR